MALTINIAFGDHSRVEPLKDGTVKPEGIDLNWINTGSGWIFHRNLYYDEFDVSEMSISSTLVAIERRGDTGRWDWSVLPVFLSSGGLVWTEPMYVNVDSGINGPGDIRGKRIAMADYEMTAALWMKIVMKDLYGIEAKDNIWYNGRTKELSRDNALGLDIDPPPGVERHWLTEDQTMDQMLEQGELDTAMLVRPETASIISGSRGSEGYTVTMERWGGTQIAGNPRIRPLCPDRGKAIFAEYHQKFGHYHQPNHHLVIQNRILREHPWVAESLVDAFRKSKEVAYQRAKYWRSAALVFEGDDWQEQAAIYGEDPYPIGMRAMRKTVERMIQGSLEQGLIRKPLRIEDIYAQATLDT